MFFLGAIAALTGTDLYLKEYFEKRDPADFPREMEGTKGLVKLYRNHNAGFPFGFLKEKKAVVTYVPLVLTSAVGGAIVGMTGALMYISGGLGVFNLLNFIDGTPGGAGISHMIYAIIAALVSAVLAFVIEFITYRPNDDEEGAR